MQTIGEILLKKEKKARTPTNTPWLPPKAHLKTLDPAHKNFTKISSLVQMQCLLMARDETGEIEHRPYISHTIYITYEHKQEHKLSHLLTALLDGNLSPAKN